MQRIGKCTCVCTEIKQLMRQILKKRNGVHKTHYRAKFQLESIKEDLLIEGKNAHTYTHTLVHTYSSLAKVNTHTSYLLGQVMPISPPFL